ncbi:MAG TPA: ribosome small subunit-dependent GTPase A [Candidatus Limnocylindria bacterium]|nr:ribosome small subunit-dependent GTPase A [Candidatus Limnocylindria bacterium]
MTDLPPTTDGLPALGWDERLATLFATEAPGLVPGRILGEERGQYVVATGAGEGPASPSGRLRHDTVLDPTAAWPAVGDWVALDPLVDGVVGAGANEHRLIQRVLTRRTAVIRRSPGDRRMPSQVLAANVDVVFVVTSVNAEFNVRRLERYLTVAWESGAVPIVLLSKSDLADDIESYRLTAEATAPGVEVIAVSIVSGEGVEAVRGHLGLGRTVVFTGSSGVGKSSIVNALAGADLLDTGGIRLDDARGRHTTTRRQLVRLAGALLIDTPGLRELGVLDGEGLSTAFDDVERTAAECRFGDCQHRSEPGCAVRAALAAGTLSRERLDAYDKLQREAQRATLATDALARRAERRKWTAIHRSVDQHMRLKYGADR